MDFEFKLTIGENEFTIKESANTHKEFIEKVTFFSSLPKTGPGGETDLKLVHRVADGKYDYYSIISDEAKMEYALGQSQNIPGALFGKGWQPLYNANNNNNTQSAGTGLGNKAQQTPVPTPTQKVPSGLGNGLGAKPQSIPEPTPQATVPTPAAATKPAAQDNAALNDVLAKYGLGNKS